MFPCTAGVDLFPCTADIRAIVSTHVETVVLLSHKKADSYIHIDVEFGEGEGKIPVDSKRQIIMRLDTRLLQPFASWSNSL